MAILIIHGPNLNMLGQREPDVYGAQTLEDLNQAITDYAASLNLEVAFFQSNHEGELIEAIQQAPQQYQGLVINPAAFTHSSIALLDALCSISIPKIEVHLSNVYARESFRHHSYTAAACMGQICGFGHYSYFLALQAMVYKTR